MGNVLDKTGSASRLSLGEIVGIWQRVLRQSRIEDDDGSFDLGGDSLQALELFREIERRTGKQFPVTAIYDASTPRCLAALLDGCAAAPFSPFVLLKPGVGNPLFLAHGLAGNVIELRKLGQAIDASHPVYAIQARGVDGTEEPFDSVPDMVAYYLAHLRKVQPHGPYYLAGYSFGGILAMEMARHLTAAGETVALLAFIDSFAHPQTFPKAALQIVRLHTVTTAFRTRPLNEACAFVLARLTGKMAGGGSGVLPKAFSPDEDADAASRKVHAAAVTALMKYWPTGYPGRVEFFRPKVSIFGVAPKRVWGRLLGGLTLHAVPGDHDSMVREHAPHLASALSAVLRRAAEAA